jgi:hypothetical protein
MQQYRRLSFESVQISKADQSAIIHPARCYKKSRQSSCRLIVAADWATPFAKRRLKRLRMKKRRLPHRNW